MDTGTEAKNIEQSCNDEASYELATLPKTMHQTDFILVLGYLKTQLQA